MNNDDILPPEIRAAFEGRPLLNMGQLSRALGMDRRTLSQHREARTLPVHVKGHGTARRHYVVTIADVTEFFKRTSSDHHI